MLGSIQIRLTVMHANESHSNESGNSTPIGHVIVGANAVGKGQLHWNQMILSLRRPVAMWHAVRQSSHSIQTGNIEIDEKSKSKHKIKSNK